MSPALFIITTEIIVAYPTFLPVNSHSNSKKPDSHHELFIYITAQFQYTCIAVSEFLTYAVGDNFINLSTVAHGQLFLLLILQAPLISKVNRSVPFPRPQLLQLGCFIHL